MFIRVSMFAGILLLVAFARAEPPPRPAVFSSLLAAIESAEQTRRPILVVVGGPACPYCRQLEKEVAAPAAAAELARWTFAKFDFEQDEEGATALAVHAIPALRVLTPTGKLVAARNGAITADQFVEWLQANFAPAGGELSPELTQTGELSALAAVKLVRELGRRDAVVREAAARRLRAHPQLAAPAVASAFADGSLSLRLTALELLQAWQAPVSGLDPWRPETITRERLAAISAWSANPQLAASTDTPEEIVAAAQQAARAELTQLLAASPAEAAAIRERLARHGPAILPLVYERLRTAEEDGDRQRLTTLRYRLVATGELALTWPGGLERVAAADATVRRQALDELATRATAADEPLLLELFSDPEPLVRELTLRALHRIGGSQTGGSLARLLDDPEPNVRAAVLKQLAEKPSKSAVARLAEYVTKEQDPDLLVHAVRVLREIKGKSAVDCLLTLLKHESWRVRAEAAAAVGAAVSDYNMQDAEKADAYVALVETLKDEDPFVVSQAVVVLGKARLATVVTPLVEVAARHPQLTVEVVKSLSDSNAARDKVAEHLQTFAKHADPQVRAAAVRGLCSVSSGPLDSELTAALADGESQVRIAAAEGLFGMMDSRYEEHGTEAPAAAEDSATPTSAGLFGQGVGKLLDLFSRPADVPPAAPVPAAPPPAPIAGEPPPELPSGGELAPLPKWMAKLADPLRLLLKAAGPAERLAGALPLLALGHHAEVLPVLRAAVAADRHQVEIAGRALRWLPWNERQPLFELLANSAGNNDDLAHVASHLAARHDPRTANLLWQLLARPDANAALTESVVYWLRRMGLGDYYYDPSRVSAKRREVVATDAQRWATSGTRWQRLGGLSLLVPLDAPAAATAAGEIAANEQLDALLRTSGFQVLLLTSEPAAAEEAALAALAGADAARQQLALTRLALGAAALQALEHEGLELDTGDLTRRGKQAAIPEPPAGLTVELLQPLVKAGGAKQRALAGFLLCLLGESEGLLPLVTYWREHGRQDVELSKLVYQSVTVLDDPAHVGLLTEIYRDLSAAEAPDHSQIGAFYWTIRSLTGPEALALRKRIRDEIGMENLRSNDPFGSP